MGFYVVWMIVCTGISQDWGQCRWTQRKGKRISACEVSVYVVCAGCVTGVVSADEAGDMIRTCLTFILIGRHQIHTPKSAYLNVREPVHLYNDTVCYTNSDAACVMLQICV